MAATGKILCKRSFRTVNFGLHDPDERVRAEARRSLRALHFRDGLDPLLRIFRESQDPLVREAALLAVGDVPILEAALVLLDIVRDEEGTLRALAVERLCSFPSSGLVPHVRAYAQVCSGNARQALETVLRALQAHRA